MRKILLHHNFKMESLRIKEQLLTILHQKGLEIVNSKPDVVVSLGGDGTMLNAIRKHHHKKVPFIGVNTGSLGFIPSVDPLHIEEMANALLQDEYKKSLYPLLKVVAITTQGEVLSAYGFNEIVVKQAAPRLMRAKVYIDDMHFNDFAGDGILLSTAFGSTGYAIWTGGAAIHPAIKALQLIPLYPNDNAINYPFKTPIIIPESSKIKIVLDRPKQSLAVAGIDGVRLSNYGIGEIEITCHEKAVQIIRLNDFNYFELYQDKIIKKK